MGVRCPDCGEVVRVPPKASAGDLVECPNCAGHGLRLTGEAGSWGARLAHRVSCPACNEVLTLPEDAKAGDAIECCGRRYRLTFEYGAFAAEDPQRAEEARDVMKPGTIGASLAAWSGALLSSLCCLLPLAVIVLGLGSGAFMAVTMAYRWLLIPAGVVGVSAGFVLYARERRRCDALGCRMAGSRVTLALLIVASAIVATSIVLDRFPEMTSELLALLAGEGHAGAGHDMKGMSGR